MRSNLHFTLKENTLQRPRRLRESLFRL